MDRHQLEFIIPRRNPMKPQMKRRGRPVTRQEVKYVPKRRFIIEPLRTQQEINRLKDYLYKTNLRNFTILFIGINTNLRASDLLNLRYGPVCRAIEEDIAIPITERKTGKRRNLRLNRAAKTALQAYFASRRFQNADELIFTRADGLPISTAALSSGFKHWCKQADLVGNFASHTMRKTWAYHHHKNGASIPTLMAMMNHRSQRQTLDYLCISAQDEIDEYDRVNL
jgi:integrase